MVSHLLTLAVSVAVAAGLTPLVRAVALRSGWLDLPARRKVKTRAVPRLGGVAIGIAVYAALALGLASGSEGASPAVSGPLLALLLGGVLMLGLGLVDDVRELPARVKFLGQILIAAGVVPLGLVIERVDTPFGPVTLGLLGAPLTVVWIVGVVNALNLIDGLDGLASGVTLIASAALYLVALGQLDAFPGVVLTAVAGAVIGFLVHNFHPASIIMGDSGSMFLGLMLAGVAIVMSHDPARPLSGAVPLLALGLPILDTAYAVVRRARAGLPIFRADREHIHHQLLAIGLSHRAAVIVLYAVSLAFGGLAVVAGWADGAIAGAIFLAAVVGGATLAAWTSARASRATVR